MTRPLTFPIVAALLVAAPIPAAAQAWQSIVVSGAQQLRPQTRTVPLDLGDRDAGYRKPARASARKEANNTPVLKMTTSAQRDLNQVPETDIRAKDEWFDDQGFRLTPNRMAFKQRF